MNFFDPACQESPRKEATFGICDDRIGQKAYTDTADPQKWGATVKNERLLEITFTAIDKCVIQDHEEIGRGRCEGMLTTNEHLYFVELKDGRENWVSGAIDQLESTVQFFMTHHDIRQFRHKKAFACNKRRGRFQEIDNELNLRFFRTYGVRLDVQAEIIVV
jgi:hypothetical protein